MKIRILSACFAMLMIACQKKEEHKKPIDTAAPEAAAMVSGKSCYEYVRNRDTVTMSLAMNANNANGELVYKLEGKDKNEGTFSGTFIGDTLYARYSFNSEGTTSVREAVFLMRKNRLIEGFGDMDEKDNMQVFKNPKNISFSESIVLEKTDCK